MGFSQVRLGPSKVFFFGFIQMIFDGLKLFISEYLFMFGLDNMIFFLIPVLRFFIILFIFNILVYYFLMLNFILNFFWIFCFLGLMVFFIILVSFFSKSKFRVLGSLRSTSIVLRFDIIFIIYCFIFIIFFKEINFNLFFFVFWFLIFFMLMLIIILMDLNRGPFDFLEGESELVRGFNLELRSFFFIFYFLSEYGFIFFFSYLSRSFFFMKNFFYIFLFFFLLLYLRVVLPRYRYDFLMFLC